MALEHCRIVLIETHYPGNLGATARVMCNFGLRDLVLVTPVANRADQNAKQMSTHGESILNKARIVNDLTEAINDCVLVVGTSGHSGGMFRRQSVGTPEEVMPHVVEALRQDRPAAILFGPEPTGLSNEVVTRCHHVIQIPTADEYASLNLAQAVAICVYELRKSFCSPLPRWGEGRTCHHRNPGADVSPASDRPRRNSLSLRRQSGRAHARGSASARQSASDRYGSESAAGPCEANSLVCRKSQENNRRRLTTSDKLWRKQPTLTRHSMIFWISAIALLLVLIFFFFFGRRETGRSFRQRYRAKRPVQRRDEPINPDFQFDQPPTDADKPMSDDPK